VDFNIGDACALRTLLGLRQDLIGQLVKGIADIALGAGKLLHVFAGQVSANRDNGQPAARRFRNLCRNLGGTLCARRTVRGHQDMVHG
jgi:hypothetical protein